MRKFNSNCLRIEFGRTTQLYDLFSFVRTRALDAVKTLQNGALSSGRTAVGRRRRPPHARQLRPRGGGFSRAFVPFKFACLYSCMTGYGFFLLVLGLRLSHDAFAHGHSLVTEGSFAGSSQRRLARLLRRSEEMYDRVDDRYAERHEREYWNNLFCVEQWFPRCCCQTGMRAVAIRGQLVECNASVRKAVIIKCLLKKHDLYAKTNTNY